MGILFSLGSSACKSAKEDGDRKQEKKVEGNSDLLKKAQSDAKSLAPTGGTGAFHWQHEPPQSAELKKYQPLFEHKRLSSVVAVMGDQFNLPRDLVVMAGECGTINAFYSPQKHVVALCYEIARFFYETAIKRGKADQEAADITLNSLTFVLLHELGHALVGELELGVMGGEEDSVDDLATILLIAARQPRMAVDGAMGMIQMSQELGKTPYFDEHSMGEQRFFNILCILGGADPKDLEELVKAGLLPAPRARRCPDEYTKKEKAWDVILDPHLKRRAQ